MSLAWASIVMAGRCVIEQCRPMRFLMGGVLGSPLKIDANVKVKRGGLHISQNICVLLSVGFIACNEMDVNRSVRLNISGMRSFIMYLGSYCVLFFIINFAVSESVRGLSAHVTVIFSDLVALSLSVTVLAASCLGLKNAI